MAIFEAITLMDEATGTTIVERRYQDAIALTQKTPDPHWHPKTEWWSLLVITINDDKGRPVGQKQVPFQINAASRSQAFENLQASMEAAWPAAEAQVLAEFEEHQRRAREQQTRNRILSAAADASLLTGRMNGKH